MKFNRIALALLLAPLAVTAQAEITFTPFATYQWFDSKKIGDAPLTQDADSHVGWAAALGWRFTPALGLEVNYGKTNTHANDTAGTNLRDSRLSLDGYYTFNTDSKFQPYVLLGAGRTNFKPAPAPVDKKYDMNEGVGAFYRFTDMVALRVEARNISSKSFKRNDQLAMIGVEFSPADTSNAPAASAPEPVVQQAPVEQLAAPVVVAPVDSDGDGVPDAQDKCPSTPAGVKVDAAGCPLDSDHDGVPDYLDKCPNTAAGVVVDADGCAETLAQDVSIDLNVNFATGKADIQGDASVETQKVADFMKKYPDANVVIEGYTDNRGNAAKNKQLSQKRADAVKAELVKMGVDAAHLTAKGYGDASPIADNKTEAGRAKNRRVVAAAKAKAKTVKMKK
jgi:OOP family OmpA-OmpF porin